MWNKKFSALAALVILTALLAAATPAGAVSWSNFCQPLNGGFLNFHGTGEDGVCRLDPPFILCDPGEYGYSFGAWQNVRYVLEVCTSNAYSTFSGFVCGESRSLADDLGISCPAPRVLSTSVEVIAGEPLDLSLGNCGAYLTSPPLNGTATLNKIAPSGVPKPSPNLAKFACQINYYDLEGNLLPGYGTLAYVYFALDAYTANLWAKDSLDLYVHDGSSWASCNPVYLDIGENGRLACATTAHLFAIVHK